VSDIEIFVPTVLVKETLEQALKWRIQQEMVQDLAEKEGISVRTALKLVTNILYLRAPYTTARNADRILTVAHEHFAMMNFPHVPLGMSSATRMASEVFLPSDLDSRGIPQLVKRTIFQVKKEVLSMVNDFRAEGRLPESESLAARILMGASFRETITETNWWKERQSLLPTGPGQKVRLSSGLSTGRLPSGRTTGSRDTPRTYGPTHTSITTTYELGESILIGLMGQCSGQQYRSAFLTLERLGRRKLESSKGAGG
jgi:hypothetical protein